MSLDDLREELGAIDNELLALIAKRQALAGKIGEEKAKSGLSTRDFSQERRVFERAREAARAHGLTATVADSLMSLLINSSLTLQESNLVAASNTGDGAAALVIGGVGRLGQWFVRFLTAQGFRVDVADTAGGDGVITDWHQAAGDYEVTVVATPIQVCNDVLLEMAKAPPSGLVFDVSSLKSPLRNGLSELAKSGAKVCSLHPMFGPSTELLSGRHVVCVDVGSDVANREAQRLFRSTMAEWVTMSLDDHDRMMAYVLGLSHAVNIVFADALAASDEQAARLSTISSTTFDAQLAVARVVNDENPDLYFEIQSLNEYGLESVSMLLASVERFRAVVKAQDREEFRRVMTRARDYLASNRAPIE